MRLEIFITKGAPQEIINVLGSVKFARDFLEMVGECVGLKDISLTHPAECCVQVPQFLVNAGTNHGLSFCLVVQGERWTSEQLSRILSRLKELTSNIIKKAKEAEGTEQMIQVLRKVISDNGSERTIISSTTWI